MGTSTPHGAGPLALIGGRLESDNRVIFENLHQLCGGRIAILPLASEFPEETGEEVRKDFESWGFHAEIIPLGWRNRKTAAHDPAIAERIHALGSVFFTGGDQTRIRRALIQDRRPTLVLEAIHACHVRGGLVAGTSAGAAVMSDPMILSGTSLDALSGDVGKAREGFAIGPGLGFFRWGMVDQHFLKRGRLGRLVEATRRCGFRYGFGVDENSAFIVRGDRAEVCGETGVIVVDLGEAAIDGETHDYAGLRISYLDDGDAYDLRHQRPHPAADKQDLAVTRDSYRRPATIKRHAFASYALHDLMLRLVEADPSCYSKETIRAEDTVRGNTFRLEIERLAGRSRALRAIRDGEIRYTALDFGLSLRPEEAASQVELELVPTASKRPDVAARLVLLGNTPLSWSSAALESLKPLLREPIGILATASRTPRSTARQYLGWLQGLGLRAEIIDVARKNIERASRDTQLLDRIDSVATLLFTGGDQRLLTDALMHCGEATPILRRIRMAWMAGAVLLGVGAAAACFGKRMIAEGNSCDALRFGVSEDAGYEGLVIREGLGFLDQALVDQNFLARQRLGRLVVACAEAGHRFGIGICEESGIVVEADGTSLTAFGRHGAVIAGMDGGRIRSSRATFQADDVSISLVRPGQRYDLESANLLDETETETAMGAGVLQRAVDDLLNECNSRQPLESENEASPWLRIALSGDNPAHLAIESRRLPSHEHG